MLGLWVGYIVRVAVCRGSGSSRGYRVSFVVGICVVGKGVVEVRLCGRGGIIAVVGEIVVVGVVGGRVGDGVVGSIRNEVAVRIVGIDVNVVPRVTVETAVIVSGINVKDGRGRGA